MATVATNAGSALLFAGTLGVATRQLAPTQLGTALSAYALSVLATDLGDFGTATWLVATDTGDETVSRSNASSLLSIRVVVGAGLVSVCGLASLSLDVPWILPAGALTAFFTAIRLLVQAKARSGRAYALSGMILLGERAVTLVLVALWRPDSSTQLLMLFALATALSAFVGVRLTNLTLGPLRGAVPIYRKARWYAVSGMGTNLAQLEVPLLSVVASPAVAGLYALPARFVSPLSLLGSALGSVLLREFHAVADARRLLIRAVICCYAMGVALAIPLLFLGKELATFIFGHKYSDASFPLQVAPLTAGVVAASQPLVAYLQVQGRSRAVGGVTLVCTFLYLALLSAGGFVGGLRGACLFALFAQVASHVALLRMVFKVSEP